MRKKAKEGRCEGRKPFGYYQGEQSTLERMKTLRAAGMAYDKIAGELNAEELKPRAGEKWHAGVIHRIIKGQTPSRLLGPESTGSASLATET
jgi:hypothetical protein